MFSNVRKTVMVTNKMICFLISLEKQDIDVFNIYLVLSIKSEIKTVNVYYKKRMRQITELSLRTNCDGLRKSDYILETTSSFISEFNLLKDK